MTDSREKIFSSLLDLIALKDPTVFQDPENFEQLMQKSGNWPEMPEISALKAGLIERFPWELQKEPNGLVTAKSAQILSKNLQKKYNFEDEVAYWAVECWAKSLGLTLEKRVQNLKKVPDKPQQQTAAPQTSEQVPVSGFSEINIGQSRLGLIFGVDEKGLIKVFKSWWSPENESEAARLVATFVKSEPPKNRPLFSGSPKPGISKTNKPIPTKKPGISQVKNPDSQQSVSAPTKKDTHNASSIAPKANHISQPKEISDPACQKANAFLPGGGGKVNIRQALKLLQDASNSGSMAARRKIAEIYLKGIGVKQNSEAASRWYLSAAENGDAEAQFQLGSLYQCGVGVPFSLEKAQDWLQKAANQGHIEAKELLNQLLQA